MAGPIIQAILAGAKAAPSLLGRTAAGAGRVAASTGKAIGTAAANPIGRTAIGAGVGGASGYAGGAAVENKLDSTLGDVNKGNIRNTSAILGALTGAGLATPLGRSQLHRMAGRAPEQNYRPIRDTFNLLTAPTFPFEKVGPAAKGTIGRYVGSTIRHAPKVMAGGLGSVAAYNVYNKPLRMANDIADNLNIKDDAARDSIINRAKDNRWKILSNVYGPNMNFLTKYWRTAPLAIYAQMNGYGRDTTPIGNSVRAANRKALIPSIRGSINYNYKNKPWLYGLADVLKMPTPAGNIANSITHSISSPDFPDVGELVKEELTNDENIAKDPITAINSPLLRNLAHTIFTPETIKDPSAREYMATNILGRNAVHDWRRTNASNPIRSTSDKITNSSLYNNVLPNLSDNTQSNLTRLQYRANNAPFDVHARAQRYIQDKDLSAMQQQLDKNPHAQLSNDAKTRLIINTIRRLATGK